jgi:hypothetical protein
MTIRDLGHRLSAVLIGGWLLLAPPIDQVNYGMPDLTKMPNPICHERPGKPCPPGYHISSRGVLGYRERPGEKAQFQKVWVPSDEPDRKQWSVVRAFDTATDCEQARTAFASGRNGPFQVDASAPEDEQKRRATAYALGGSECVPAEFIYPAPK